MLQTGGRTVAKEKAPKPPKIANIQDFQFYPLRLKDLQKQETQAFQREIGYKVRPEDIDGDLDEEAQAARIQEEQAKIDSAEPLTEVELEEKEKLLSKGFGDWVKRDFVAFCKALEKYGRNDLDGVARDMEGKTPAEVKQYAAVFWKRHKELADYEKIIANIEKGESRLRKTQEIQDALTAKVKQHRAPLQQLRLQYSQSKGKNYTEEEDRFLLVTLERLGYGSDDVYERILHEVKTSPLFRFDWFIKSRTVVEIQRRCTSLVTLVTKEAADASERAVEEQKVREREEKEKEKEAAVASSGRKRKSVGGSAGKDDKNATPAGTG
ncbi:hypothetical protein HKX48_002851, partial [Thoreauomyces humboldtii]